MSPAWRRKMAFKAIAIARAFWRLGVRGAWLLDKFHVSIDASYRRIAAALIAVTCF